LLIHSQTRRLWAAGHMLYLRKAKPTVNQSCADAKGVLHTVCTKRPVVSHSAYLS